MSTDNKVVMARPDVQLTHYVFTDTPRGHATKPTKLGFVAFIRFCSLYKTAVLDQITANEVMGLCHRRRQILRVQLLNVQQQAEVLGHPFGNLYAIVAPPARGVAV